MLDLDEAKKICRVQEQKQLASSLGLDGWLKYLEEDQFLSEKLEIFQLLKLHTKQPSKILDVGAGIGQFGSLCKHYGHKYLGTYFGRTGKTVLPFFNDSGLDSVQCGLFPSYDKDIPNGPWDCIVMIRTTFELNSEWHIDDWRELVQSCMNNLNQNGQLLIKSNLSVEPKRKYGNLVTECQERMMAAFPEKTPLPHTQWATWHWIKE